MRSTRIFGISLLAAVGMLALLAAPSQARFKDRNHDRIPDKWERHYHLSLRVNQARRDQDHDGLNNRAEFRAQDDPRDSDSDNNGIEDGQENAGKITDISGSNVTVTLFGGGTIIAMVAPQTEVECDTGGDGNGDGTGDESVTRSGGPSFRDDSGEGGDHHEGDDQGEQGDDNDQGDDNEQDNEACPPGALHVGAVVQEAEVKLSNGAAVFEKLELVG
ncbi:MAG: hypothetical protein C5B48_16615 [Candidatus Rokuibacteriota bacterium]|nr:MAG: hypothetical protein C5B48_16615 [Candidatus Rokubacteria bacterium]